MSDELSLREAYFIWLEPQVKDEQGHRTRTFRDLLWLMFETPFVELVPHDDNRMQDGLDLRMDFMRTLPVSYTLIETIGPCSFLEVMIGLSKRLAFAAGGDAEGWAGQLLHNLELHRMTDPLSSHQCRKVARVLDRVIWRKYDPDGQGGFFPLTHPTMDQCHVELWYQMGAYINEIHPEY